MNPRLTLRAGTGWGVKDGAAASWVRIFAPASFHVTPGLQADGGLCSSARMESTPGP
jgi:hypothetical protein